VAAICTCTRQMHRLMTQEMMRGTLQNAVKSIPYTFRHACTCMGLRCTRSRPEKRISEELLHGGCGIARSCWTLPRAWRLAMLHWSASVTQQSQSKGHFHCCECWGLGSSCVDRNRARASPELGSLLISLSVCIAALTASFASFIALFCTIMRDHSHFKSLQSICQSLAWSLACWRPA